MRLEKQLVIESAAIASVMIMLTLGGSVATTTTPGSFLPLQNPVKVAPQSDLSALAGFYNTTLTQIGSGHFANASFLLDTFRFINVPSDVNSTAQGANADLASVNTTVPQALALFASAKLAIQEDQLMNATALVSSGCSLAATANSSIADFNGPETTRFSAESVPTRQYAGGENLASAEIGGLNGECASLSRQVETTGTNGTLVIGSSQKAVETGGEVGLFGSLTKGGTGIAGQEVHFYINGSYFGTLISGARGSFGGALDIPFVYFQTEKVQALVAPNSTIAVGGALSNVINFSIIFNQTRLVVGDPPEYLPGQTFYVHGNLTTTSGIPLPDALVTVTYLGFALNTTTGGAGAFVAQFAVPGNATDGTYRVYARFSPSGSYGPSFNFTSIDVYHLPLNLTLTVPGLSWAGFSTHIDGTATSNGTAVPDANITLVSPWGSARTTTSQGGRFEVSFPVSPLEFAFSKNVTLSASPAQPYVADSTVVATLGLFNIMLVILPAAVLGVGVYEANNLGAFGGIESRVRRRRGNKTATLIQPDVVEAPQTHGRVPELLGLFSRALALASARFSIEFSPSQTIREVLSEVSSKGDGEAFLAFSTVLLAAEDFLYGRRFDKPRVSEAGKALAALERLWS